jgi:hypothetical protein
MSLKAFHIVFIGLASALAVVFAVWEFIRYHESGEGMQLVAGFLALAAALGLVLYGIRFLRKLRKVSFI